MPAMAAARASAKSSVLKSLDGKMAAMPFFKLVFIHSDFLFVIIVGFVLFLYHFLVGVTLLYRVCVPMGVFVVGRAPVVCLAIPLLSVTQFPGELAKRGLFLSFSVVLELCPELSLNCWNFSCLVATEQPWPRSVPLGSCQKASTVPDSTGLCISLVFR